MKGVRLVFKRNPNVYLAVMKNGEQASLLSGIDDIWHVLTEGQPKERKSNGHYHKI